MKKTVIETFSNLAPAVAGTITVTSMKLSVVGQASVMEVAGHSTGTIILANVFGVGQVHGAPNQIVINAYYQNFGTIGAMSTIVPMPTTGSIPAIKLLVEGV